MCGMLTVREAEEALAEAEVIPIAQAGMAEAKEIQSACLQAGVPALLGRDNHCTKGCAPKLFVLVRQDDAQRVASLMQQRWVAMAVKGGTLEGISPVGADEDPEGNPPCPACGDTSDLVDGACAECGLQLG
jgi:hypothetical protein